MHAMSIGTMKVIWLDVFVSGSIRCLLEVEQGCTLRGVTVMGLS